MNDKYQVSAAIVTYNRLSLLKESLSAVLSQDTTYLHHVIVIDNHSNDGTAEWLDALDDPRLIIKHLDNNLGGAGGFNAAVREFGENTIDDAIWLMDDDTIPQIDALSTLAKFAQSHPKIGFVNSNVRWQTLDGVPAWMNVVAPRGFFWSKLMTRDENAVEVVNSTFVSVLIPRYVIEQIGLPQKEYFIWGDDIEYTNRAADVHRGYFLPNSVVIHKSKVNATPGDIVEEHDQTRLWRYDYEFRNRLLTARRVGGNVAVYHSIRHTLRHDFSKLFFRSNVKFRFKKIKSVFFGTIKGLFFNPPIEYLFDKKPSFTRSINAIEQKRAEFVRMGHIEVKHMENEDVEKLIVEKFGPQSVSKKHI